MTLDELIAEARDDVGQYPLDDPRHAIALDKLERLSAIKRANTSSEVDAIAKTARKPLDPNVVVTSGGALAGILAIVSAERTMVLASKALTLIPRILPRIL